MKKAFMVPKESRKIMVKDIEKITGLSAKYLGVPSCAYQIGEFLVNKDCSIESENAEALEELSNCLDAAGYIEREDPALISISMPAEKVNVENLICLLAAKGDIIKKALGIKDIGFRTDKDRVWFPWFNNSDPAEMHAYAKFIEAICRMSMEQKRVSTKSMEVENEKYYFRCFLLRLGFIGDEFKADRKVLLRNLEGSPAWKTVSK